ncbi:MAG: hypothetical protein L6R00_06380 [Phycisphaerae bacterium]|nr:hypothetical protein [Phycisphaerae bacterium]
MTFDELLRVANILTPVLVAIVGFAVRQTLARISDRIARLEDDRRGDIKRMIAAEERMDVMAETFVRREDWIREQARTRQTLERLVEGQARMEGKIDAASSLAVTARLLAARPEGDAHE